MDKFAILKNADRQYLQGFDYGIDVLGDFFEESKGVQKECEKYAVNDSYTFADILDSNIDYMRNSRIFAEMQDNGADFMRGYDRVGCEFARFIRAWADHASAKRDQNFYALKRLFRVSLIELHKVRVEYINRAESR